MHWQDPACLTDSKRKCCMPHHGCQHHTSRLLQALRSTKEVQVEARNKGITGNPILSKVYHTTPEVTSFPLADKGSHPGFQDRSPLYGRSCLHLTVSK